MMLDETWKVEKTPLLRVAESALESYSIRIRLELIFMDAHHASHFRYLVYKLTDAIFDRSLAEFSVDWQQCSANSCPLRSPRYGRTRSSCGRRPAAGNAPNKKTVSTTQNNRLTGKALYKFESVSLLR